MLGDRPRGVASFALILALVEQVGHSCHLLLASALLILTMIQA